MEPLVYDPSWKRDDLWWEAIRYVKSACQLWALPQPILTRTAPPGAQKFSTGGTYYGHWISPNHIFVNVAKATSPARVRGRVWSYPGYKIDRTCAGILAHEFGHHAAGNTKMNANDWRKVVAETLPVSGYEPTANEAWAESMRVFILNPDLLRQGRRLRYEYITQHFGPLHDATWQEVLKNAPEFIREQAEKFCRERFKPRPLQGGTNAPPRPLRRVLATPRDEKQTSYEERRLV